VHDDDDRLPALSRWARVARGSAAAAFATFAAAFSHVLGGGSAPSTLAIVLAVTFSVLACIALVGRRFARVRMAASVIVSQVAYHALFALVGAPGAASVTHSGAHDHAAALVVQGTPNSASLLHSSDGMMLAHAIAAVVTIAVILWAERAFRAAAAGTRFVLRAWHRAVALVPVDTATGIRLACERTPLLPCQLPRLAGTLTLRGPPSAGPAAA
jgi:hypothetical protein